MEPSAKPLSSAVSRSNICSVRVTGSDCLTMPQSWLRKKVFPKVFNKDGAKFVECVLDTESTGQDQFQSEIIFLSAVVQNADTKTKIPLVVKFELPDLEVRKLLHTSLQFYNEVLMYKEILPFLDKLDIVEELFAKCYYGVGLVEENEKNPNIVVLQDLRPLGYKLSGERAYLDFEHISIALTKLGKFHALSYAAKKQSPEMFFKLTHKLEETSWTEGSSFNTTICACIKRAFQPLIDQGRDVETLQSFLDSLKDIEDLTKFMKKITTPEEPSAVICHGDFCRNNIFFKYDSEEKPTYVKFFDVATARYSSPAVDIVFFLLLNGSRDLRRAHWDDLISIYHKALSTTVPGLEVPSLECVREEIRLKAFYGFVHCSFFLPMMLFDSPYENLNFLDNMSPEQVAAVQSTWGGEEATKVLSDVVEDLIDLGCLVKSNKYIFPV